MKYRYIGKNLDLNSLVEAIELFFTDREFNTGVLNRQSDTKVIKAVLQRKGEVRSVIVNVFGKPEDFTVEFLGGELARSILKFGSLMSLFGGALLLKVHQGAEFYQKLEEEFRIYLDKFVACSTNSVKSSSSQSKSGIQNVVQGIPEQNEGNSQ